MATASTARPTPPRDGAPAPRLAGRHSYSPEYQELKFTLHRKLLDRINRTGTTVVMATHDRGIVDVMRRRVIELEGGQIVRDQARGVYE